MARSSFVVANNEVHVRQEAVAVLEKLSGDLDLRRFHALNAA
jgi:hypothetical protein